MSPQNRRENAKICDGRKLLSQAERRDDLAVTIEIGSLEVIEKAAALADHLQKAAARMVIFRVGSKVVGQVRDALGENRNLDFGRPRVAVVLAKLADNGLLAILMERHGFLSSSADPGDLETEGPGAGKWGRNSTSVASVVNGHAIHDRS